MKNVILAAATVLFAANAHASFFMIECSNANGTIKTTGGHMENKLKLVVSKFENGKVKKSNVTMDLANVEQEVVKETSISSESNQVCEPGSNSGYSSWKSIEVQEVKIKKADGSKFAQGTTDLQEDGSIKTTLLCQNDGNSMILCENSSGSGQ